MSELTLEDWRGLARKWESRAKDNLRQLEAQKNETIRAQSLVVGQAEIMQDIRAIIRDELENYLGENK